MQHRQIGPLSVAAIGLGCMNLSHAYGVPPDAAVAERLLLRALELGVTLFDTAALYGFGANETLLGKVLKPHRSKLVLASKCGMTGVQFADGMRRVIDGRPQTIKATCDSALQRLQTEMIDLYYLHRLDPKVPIEDSVGALAELVAAGKIRSIGLSEVSAATLRRAHAVHPITALQSEYSLWSRNPEIAGLATCRQLGIAFVAFSPLARGFLSGALRTPADAAAFDAKDIRRHMPRFAGEHLAANLQLLQGFAAVADEVGCTPAQLALAWVLAQGEHIIPIPGTTQIAHLEENLAADAVRPSAKQLQRLSALINQHNVSGPRYNAATQAEIDTEEF